MSTIIKYIKVDRYDNEEEVKDDLYYWLCRRVSKGHGIEEQISNLSDILTVLLTKAIEKDHNILQDVIYYLKEHREKDFSIVKEES